MAIILMLPLELYEEIFRYLGRRDLKCLRLASRKLAAVAGPSLFAEAFLTVDAEESFVKLDKIASNDYLRDHVKNLHYSGDISNKLKARRLSNIVESFPKLTSVHFNRKDTVLNITTQASPRSRPLSRRQRLLRLQSDSFVSEYNRSHFFRFLETADRHDRSLSEVTGTGLELDRLCIYDRDEMHNNRILRQITRLCLDFKYSENRALSSKYLAYFLEAAGNLETLELSFGFVSTAAYGNVHIGQLLTHRKSWPKLKRLKLQGIVTERETLKSLLRDHASTLISLELSHIDLSDDLPDDPLVHPDGWIDIILFLRSKMFLKEVRFNGKLTNGLGHGWVSNDELTENNERFHEGQPLVQYNKDSLRYRIEYYVTHGGEFPIKDIRDRVRRSSSMASVGDESWHPLRRTDETLRFAEFAVM